MCGVFPTTFPAQHGATSCDDVTIKNENDQIDFERYRLFLRFFFSLFQTHPSISRLLEYARPTNIIHRRRRFSPADIKQINKISEIDSM